MFYFSELDGLAPASYAIWLDCRVHDFDKFLKFGRRPNYGDERNWSGCYWHRIHG